MRSFGLLAAAVAGSTLGTPSIVGAQTMPDLVSRTRLRVCADPANMPFSDKSKAGFENKIADIVGDALKRPVQYLWAPSGPGFARNTLNSDLCDIVIGYAVGSDVMQSTNPYYRSTYAIVTKAGSPLAAVRGLDDKALTGRPLGVFAATPPVDLMLKRGLMDRAKVYPLLVDHRFDSPLKTMMEDLAAGRIDAAIVWGPLAGLDVKKSGGAIVMTPLVDDADRPGFSYRISFGIRHDEPDWKHKLEDIERDRAADIDKVLVDFGVPLIDNAGHPIPPDRAITGAATLDVSGGNEKRSRKAAQAAPEGFKMPGPAPTNAAPAQP